MIYYTMRVRFVLEKDDYTEDTPYTDDDNDYCNSDDDKKNTIF